MSSRARRIAALVVLCIGAAGVAHAAPGVGNAWHVAEGAEPGVASMRAPIRPPAGADVTIVTGNQYQGAGGNPGNQTQTGSTLFYRSAHQTAWTAAPLAFLSASGNNKYYRGAIPASAFQGGDNVEYYLRIAYSDHATTFLFGDDAHSSATTDEAVAQASPFAYALPWPDTPAGDAVKKVRGPIEARVARASGHVSIVGPTLAGAPLGNVITLRPPMARVDGRWLTLGAVIATKTIADGVELTQELGRRVATTRLTVPADGVVRYEVIDWGGTPPSATTLDAPSPVDEHFFGLGEKFNAFDQAGRRVHVLTSDFPGDKGDHSYKVAPWFASTRGYGFRLDSSAESFFDLRSSAPDHWSIDHRFSTMRFELVYGPRLTDVLSRYTARVGRPTLPPEWVFGPWMSSDIWRSGGEVRYVVTRMIERGIPGSVFVFDSPWEVAYNDFQWNMTQFGQGGTFEGQAWPGFASVGDMMTFLKSHGFKVVVWLTPFVNTSSFDEGVAGQNLGKASIYDEGVAGGFFVRSSPGGAPLVVDWWKGRGSPVDFTNPAARAWFAGKLAALVAESGGAISGFKIDDGEGDYIPLTASYADGRTGVEMRNGYTLEYHRAVAAVLGDQGVLFARSGFAGTEAFPACWAGDNEPNFGDGNGLPSVIVAGQSAAMSGYAIWAHDIGGYQDHNLSSTPANLFMRWAQFGALSPIMQMHRQVGLGLQYPWSFGDDALANYRQYARLHTALFPYVYSYAKQAADTGVPIIRPLVLLDQSDANTYAVDHTYRFGDELLVAPMITNDATERRLYLPAGRWIDFWSNEHVDGGAVVTWRNADQTKVPLYVREGAIVPMLAGAVQTLAPAAYVGNPAIATSDGSLELRIYPKAAATAKFHLYDGTQLEAKATGATIKVTIDGAARSVKLRVLAAGARSVKLGTKALPHVASEAALDAATAGWVEAGGFVLAKLAHAGGKSTVTIKLDAPFDEPSTDDDGDDGDAGGGCAAARGRGSSATCLVLIGALALGVRRRRRARRRG